jgi:HK97 family phage major capsid protein
MPAPSTKPFEPLGLTPKEIKEYSVLRAMVATLHNDFSRAGLEAECTRAEYARRGTVPSSPHTFVIPQEILQRDLTAGTGTAGGYLVGTGVADPLPLLRNRSVCVRLGATVLDQLQGSLSVPRITSGSTGYWLANEATPITESQPVIGQFPLSPKNVGGYTEISRQLLLQTGRGAERMVMNDLAATVALAVDKAALSGAGTGGEPTGITATSGIGTFTGASIDYAKVLDAVGDLMSANIEPDGTIGWVTTPAVATILAQRVKFTSTASPLWEGSLTDGSMLGFRAMSSNQMGSGTMLLGRWSDLVIAEWGRGLEVELNPYAGFAAGVVGVRAFYTVDVGVRYPGAFSLGTGIS